MIKAILIDDEAHVRNDIREKIEQFFCKEIAIMAEADSVSTGLLAITKFEPNLLFLDIHLADGTGFDLLTQSEFKNFEIIFITGYDNLAIKAIKAGALDYLLKPVDENEFRDAVNKAIKSTQKESQLEKLIEISSEYFRGVEKKRVILKTADTVYAVYEDDIIYCKSNGNYTTFYTKQSEKIMVSKPIKKIEEILSEEVFVRCHQSYVVNKKHVFKYDKQGYLIAQLGFKIPVSSRRKDYTLAKIFH